MFEKYRVKANDNLEDIAKKFRTNKFYIVFFISTFFVKFYLFSTF